MRESPLINKSKTFALEVLDICKQLRIAKCEGVLINQFIRCGTYIGANIREAFYALGKLDEKTGLLIPNRNYYEVYLKQIPPIKGGIHNYGIYYVFSEICEQLGITKILKRWFPECYREIVRISQYMLTESNTMYYLEDYTVLTM